MMTDPIQFRGYFPPIQSAIKISGSGDGMRIIIDIPEIEMSNAVQLLALRECGLVVTIERDEQSEQQRNHRKTTY
jgi:HSP20 family molecular chaperone IbpA